MRTMHLAALAAALTAPPALAQQPVDPIISGHAYATRVCAQCHLVEAGAAGVSGGGAPAFTAVANTPGMSETALGAFFQTSHRSMPNFILAAADQRNVIAYILSLKQ